MKKIFLFFGTLFVTLSLHSQTYFGSSSFPADNGTNTAASVTVTPPASMVVRDLVIAVCQNRNTSSTIIIAADGGQNWQIGTTTSASNNQITFFWCVFTGTWDTDPTFQFQFGTCNTVSLHVFRPSAADKTWGIDRDLVGASYAAPGGPPYEINYNPANTSVNAKSIIVGVVGSVDDNTYTLNAGSAYSVVSTAQYRNLGGADQSHVVTYQVVPTAGSDPNDFTVAQATLGPDLGIKTAIWFYEYTPTTIGSPLWFFKN